MVSMRLHAAAGIVAIALASPASAAETPLPIESLQTLRIDGDVTIDAAGAPIDYRPTTSLSDAQRAVLDRLVRSWRFTPAPANVPPVPVTAHMRITLAARPNGQGYDVVVDDVKAWGAAEVASNDALTAAGRVAIHGRLSPPAYPPMYAAAGVSATVHLLLRIGPDGRVREVAADQVALLNVYGAEAKLRRALVQFEEAATKQARSWQFDVTLRAGQPQDAEVVVGVPLTFLRFGGDSDDRAGQWRSETRQRRPLPAWARGGSVADDAFGIEGRESDRFRLRTAVVGTKVM